MAVQQVLVGFYDIPKSVEQPLQLVINPEGAEARGRKVVWNRNDNRVSPGQRPEMIRTRPQPHVQCEYDLTVTDQVKSNSIPYKLPESLRFLPGEAHMPVVQGKES